MAARSSQDFGLPLAGDRKARGRNTFELSLRLAWRHERDLSGRAMHLGLPQNLLGIFHRRFRFTDATP